MSLNVEERDFYIIEFYNYDGVSLIGDEDVWVILVGNEDAMTRKNNSIK